METLMSAGPGKIMRAIAAIAAAEPDDAHSVDELCERIYPDVKIEKRHRVAVIRAMRNVASQNDELEVRAAYRGRGGPLVLFRPGELRSYAMFRLLESFGVHKPKACLRSEIEPRGGCHEFVQPGGAWEREVQLANAERSGDAETAQRIRAAIDAEFSRWEAGMKEMAEALGIARRHGPSGLRGTRGTPNTAE